MANTNELYKKYGSTLNRCELFQGMDEKQWNDLLNHFHEEEWPRESCFINHQKFLFHFFIIVSGRVKMYNVDDFSEKEHTLFLLKKGDVFDLFCLLDGVQHQVYYECIDPLKVLAVPMDDLRDWLKKNPAYYQGFLSYAGKMMRMLEENVSQLIFTDISTRLLKLLLSNVDYSSNRLQHINDLPNKEIANLIGSTRAVVNRHLQKLKRNGSIKVSRNKVQIRDISILLKELNNQNKKL
ncbi:Crp/Fnr family transcriptional regulator [Gramella sp. GC03-9]|uniref:Crp/Fnr family transcriptional regulator n=1 Tax=Christiangramia oceanisediminis TaxID=2920386 RepID=A0A9X2KY24_9FLAO|nr:Crp/Fnr family transcriptional regulator [Gramella oceanisediminis]MCP9200367.1 Crp/Fnr family transcriptional regulator [Gramella oceanisediminis]